MPNMQAYMLTCAPVRVCVSVCLSVSVSDQVQQTRGRMTAMLPFSGDTGTHPLPEHKAHQHPLPTQPRLLHKRVPI